MIIGLTGGIGSGKSFIAHGLVKQGFAVYDCDREAKRIIMENAAVRHAIIELLGEEAFVPSPQHPFTGSYNTSYVSQRVFAEPELLQQLNAIVHPAVKEDIKGQISEVRILFVESAILFEAGLDELCDKIVVVEAPEEVRIERTIARDYHGEATPANIKKVRARIRAQKTSADVAPRRPILTVLNDGKSVLSSIIDLICDFATR